MKGVFRLIDVQRKIINYNKTPNANNIKYIVIHDTGNPSPTADAMNHYRYFSGGNRNASAHYFIDKDNIIQIIDDKDGAWHVGDGKNKNGINNRNSIGIEMCINDMKNIDKVVNHTLDLTIKLMKKYNIPIKNVVRHNDASKKRCPNFMSANNWAKWHDFKNTLSLKLNNKGEYLDMTKAELNKLLDDREEQLVAKILRQVETEIVKKGETSDHWADLDFNELNEFLSENEISIIADKRHNDLGSRGENIRMLNLVRKAIQNSIK